jgi:hypothetical protein
MSTPSLSTLRRRAAAQGYRLWKVPNRSSLDWEYGPYTLTIVVSNEVALSGVGLPELADFLEQHRCLLPTVTVNTGEGVRRDDTELARRQLVAPLPKLWTLDHLIRRQWSITNRSGATARSVTFTASGALVISGRPEWTAHIGELGDCHGFAITGTSGWGSTFNQPQIRVTWLTDDRRDQMQAYTLRWPTSAISFPGVRRQVHPAS